jgi:hypothetical protein
LNTSRVWGDHGIPVEKKAIRKISRADFSYTREIASGSNKRLRILKCCKWYSYSASPSFTPYSLMSYPASFFTLPQVGESSLVIFFNTREMQDLVDRPFVK